MSQAKGGPFAGTAVCMVVYDHRPDTTSLEVALRHARLLVLIDNGSRPEIREALGDFAAKFPGRVLVWENETNLGLSQAYNRAVRGLKHLGIEWVYFLDHDATFGDGFFEETRNAWTRLERNGLRVGIVVPIATDDPRLAGRTLGFRRSISDLRTTMTSGIFTRLDVFESVGGFDERLFVEAADLDFTSRVAHAGYRVCMVNRVLIVQQFGLSADPVLTPVRIGDRLIRFRSLVRVGIGNSNEYRTRLFYYPTHRHAGHLRTLRWIIRQGYPWKNLVRLSYYLTVLEHLYVTEFALPFGRADVPDPLSENAPTPSGFRATERALRPILFDAPSLGSTGREQKHVTPALANGGPALVQGLPGSSRLEPEATP